MIDQNIPSSQNCGLNWGCTSYKNMSKNENGRKNRALFLSAYLDACRQRKHLKARVETIINTKEVSAVHRFFSGGRVL